MKRSLLDTLINPSASSVAVQPLHPVAEAIGKFGREVIGVARDLAQNQLDLADAQEELESQQPVSDSPALTWKNAAKLLGCGRTTIFRLLKQRKLKKAP